MVQSRICIGPPMRSSFSSTSVGESIAIWDNPVQELKKIWPIQQPCTFISYGHAEWESSKSVSISIAQENKEPDYSYKVRELIKKSKSLLKLKDNWDGEGSSAISNKTWRRATNFIMQLAMSYYDFVNSCIDVPEILPGPDDTIDILWDFDKYELLLNVPSDINKPMSFFGLDKVSNRNIKLVEDKHFDKHLVLWLSSRNV